MVFRENFRKLVKEATGMPLSTFLEELGINYGKVKELDEGTLDALSEYQLKKVCDRLQVTPQDLARLWDEDYEQKPQERKLIKSAEELKEKLTADGVLKLKKQPAKKAKQVKQPTAEPKAEAVNHPKHYNHGGVECIDVIAAVVGKEGVRAFCVGNMIKYLYRCDDKGGKEDVEKAKWYVRYLAEKLKAGGDEV